MIIGGSLRRLLIVGSLIAVLAVAACTADGRAPVRILGGDIPPKDRAINLSMGSTLGRPKAVVVPLSVCGTRDVHVEDVELIEPDGLRLVSWGISNRGDNEGEASSLARLGSYTLHDIDARCSSGDSSRVGVELIRTGAASASTGGVRLRYRAGDGVRSLTLWAGLALCGRDGPVPTSFPGDDETLEEQAARLCHPVR